MGTRRIFRVNVVSAHANTHTHTPFNSVKTNHMELCHCASVALHLEKSLQVQSAQKTLRLTDGDNDGERLIVEDESQLECR